MAVSMNSGFMRSDYMISDAALPLRMEELEQLEQLDREAKFADILGEIGDATAKETPDAPKNEAMPTNEKPAAISRVETDDNSDVPALGKSELKALARAVAQGKVKLDEIPQEYVTDVLLMVVAMMMLGIPEDEIPVAENTSEDEIKPVQVDIRTAEAFLSKVEENTNITELLQILSETADVEIPEDMMQKSDRRIETVTLDQEISSEKTAAPVANNVVTEDVKAEAENSTVLFEVSEATDQAVTVQSVIAEEVVAESAVMQNVPAPKQQSSDSQQNVDVQAEQQAAAAEKSTSTEQMKFTEEFEQLRRVITEYTVKRPEATEQPVQQSYTAQAMGGETTAKSRVVSKSEELEILKIAAKPTELNLNAAIEGKAEAQNNSQSETDLGADAQQLPMEQMPQSMVPDTPVVFVRSDGTQVEVRPSEIVRQITTNIVEQTTTAEGDTEYSITLTPEDLGSITVKLTKTIDGAMTVSITAENARTQRLIEQHGAAIQESLKQNNIELESWQTVNQSGQQYKAQDYNGSSGNPYYRDDSEDKDDENADDTSFAELISAM